MPTGNGSLSDSQVLITDAAGGVLDGLTRSATFNSIYYKLQGAEWFGIFVETTNKGGTTPTLTVTVEWTPDSSITTPIRTEYPGAANVDGIATQAGLPVISDANETNMEYWGNVVPLSNSAAVRFIFTIGGSAGQTFDIRAYLFTANRGA